MKEIKLPSPPLSPCYICGGREYWLRIAGKPEWLCSRCRPAPPDGIEKKMHTVGEGRPDR